MNYSHMNCSNINYPNMNYHHMNCTNRYNALEITRGFTAVVTCTNVRRHNLHSTRNCQTAFCGSDWGSVHYDYSCRSICHQFRIEIRNSKTKAVVC